jgi:hypothetical protein
MRKGLTYLLVLLVLLYGWFLLVQTGGRGNREQPAGRHLMRIGQLDPDQYASVQEYHTWASSTCSTAAMTEVANYYGGNYRITDLLAVQARIGEITPEQGLLEDAGIARTMEHFGFVTTWGYGRSLDQVVALANQGTPVIVAFPPSRYPGGHLLVVTGGDEVRVWWPIPLSGTAPPSLARDFWRCGLGLWQWSRHKEDRWHVRTAS